MRYAIGQGYDYAFILNSDAVVQQEALSEMVRSVAGKAEIGMVAPAVYDYARKDVVDRMGLALTRAGLAYERQSGSDGVLFCPSGCAALYNRSLRLAVERGGHYVDRISLRITKIMISVFWRSEKASRHCWQAGPSFTTRGAPLLAGAGLR